MDTNRQMIVDFLFTCVLPFQIDSKGKQTVMNKKQN